MEEDKDRGQNTSQDTSKGAENKPAAIENNSLEQSSVSTPLIMKNKE